MKIFFLSYLFISFLVPLKGMAELSEEGFFSGRISKINKDISIVRVKVNFDNIKYLNPKDKIEFWDEKNSSQKCKSYIIARSSDYLLLKLPEMEFCQKFLYITLGSYFKFYSEDLLNNINMGREVVSILLKKRTAIKGQLDGKKIEINTHIERVNVINARYQTLKDKLDNEWKKELYALEEDNTYAVRSFRDLERRFEEIDQKLEQYKIKDENLTLDRWSLDSHLYFKK